MCSSKTNRDLTDCSKRPWSREWSLASASFSACKRLICWRSKSRAGSASEAGITSERLGTLITGTGSGDFSLVLASSSLSLPSEEDDEEEEDERSEEEEPPEDDEEPASSLAFGMELVLLDRAEGKDSEGMTGTGVLLLVSVLLLESGLERDKAPMFNEGTRATAPFSSPLLAPLAFSGALSSCSPASALSTSVRGGSLMAGKGSGIETATGLVFSSLARWESEEPESELECEWESEDAEEEEEEREPEALFLPVVFVLTGDPSSSGSWSSWSEEDDDDDEDDDEESEAASAAGGVSSSWADFLDWAPFFLRGLSFLFWLSFFLKSRAESMLGVSPPPPPAPPPRPTAPRINFGTLIFACVFALFG